MKNLKYVLILLSFIVLVGATSLIKIENVRGLVTALNERPTKTEADTVYYKVNEGLSATTYFYTREQVDSILNARYGSLQLIGSKLTYTESGKKYIAKTDSVENLGPELVANGAFSNGTGWDNYYGFMTFSGGVAQINTGSTTYDEISYQTIGIANSKTYKVNISITAYTSGELVIGLGNQSGPKSTPMTAVGNYSFTITATQSSPLQVILIVWDAAFVGSVDNISVKEVL